MTIYLSSEDNLTREAVKQALQLVAHAHALIAGIDCQELNGIEGDLVQLTNKIEDIEFAEAGE